MSIILALATRWLFLVFLFHPSTTQLPPPGDKNPNTLPRLFRPSSPGPNKPLRYYVLWLLTTWAHTSPPLAHSHDWNLGVPFAAAPWSTLPPPQSHPQSPQSKLTSLKYLDPFCLNHRFCCFVCVYPTTSTIFFERRGGLVLASSILTASSAVCLVGTWF